MQSHFIKIGADGAQLPADVSDHVAVLDQRTGLMWSARLIADQRFTHAQAKKACAELKLAGSSDWRLPEIEELFTLCDRSRFNPAIDTDSFRGIPSSWFWTATLDAEAPSSHAWGVLLYGGLADVGGQDYSGRVLACRRAARASQ